MALIRRASKRLLFVDASAYVALYLRTDEHHPAAREMLERLTQERWHHYTTTIMVAEAHARLVRRVGQAQALSFIEAIYASEGTDVELIGHDDEKVAREILQRYSDKEFSYADALAFAVMRRDDITWAFSFDEHFKAYGRFTVLDSPDAW